MSAKFISFLADRLEGFIAYRGRLGYRAGSPPHMERYRRFDRFIARHMRRPGPLSRVVVEDYLRLMPGRSRREKRRQMTPVLSFLKYLQRFEPGTYVPDACGQRPRKGRTRFRSCLADHLQSFIDLRTSMGYRLSGYLYAYKLFDDVLAQEMEVAGPITRDVMEAFVRSMDQLRSTTRKTRLAIIRQFLHHYRQVEPDTYIPDRYLDPSRGFARRPHIYSEEEIRSLLYAARDVGRHPGDRWLLYPTLLGLLAVTGLRISEALDLTLGDVDLKDALLRVRKAKFQKPRLVPIADSTCLALKRFLVARAERGYATTPEAPLFPSRQTGRRMSYGAVCQAFRDIRRAAGLGRPSAGGCRPRIHDLRHTAATRRLHLWYREGANVQALLPVLVTYLGHASVRGTATYLTSTAELLGEASARQERLLALQEGGSR